MVCSVGSSIGNKRQKKRKRLVDETESSNLNPQQAENEKDNSKKQERKESHDRVFASPTKGERQ